MRLIVTDNSTAARTLADRLAKGKARDLAVHRVPVFEADDGQCISRVIGLGGLLALPAGADARWEPARRAPANALRMLARSADSLMIATDDPLLAVQARAVAGEGQAVLVRAARMGDPWTSPRQLDDLAADARAVALEIDAMFAATMRALDPALGIGELAALGAAARGPVAHRKLGHGGVGAGTLALLAERGYLVGDPAWQSPAGEMVCGAVDPALLGCDHRDAVGAWVDAVRRGTLARAVARERAVRMIGRLRPARAVDGLAAGRLIGRCPECDEWMGGATDQVRCMGCGLSYRLPRRVEALAVPGSTCQACDAPMIVPVVHGRRDEPRCPDTAGCPTRLETTVGR